MTLQRDPEYNEIKSLRKFANFTGKRVLEIGSGEGRLTWQYAKWTDMLSAVDADTNALRVAKVDRPDNLEHIVLLTAADSSSLPYPKERFDIAILAWSL